MTSSPRPDPWAWGLFAASSLCAVLVGCAVTSAHGASAPAGILDMAAWVVGAGLAALLARTGASSGGAWMLAAMASLAATFLAPGLSGVHRWIVAGPFRLNAAELLLPAAIVGAATSRLGSRWVLAWLAGSMALLVLQPDASQAVALGGAAMTAALARRAGPVALLLTGLVAVGGGLAAVWRPDPLPPVPEVEGVIGLAASLSWTVAAAALLALAANVAAPLLLAPTATPPVRAAALGLGAYFALSALAPLAGAFPVPLVGLGVSPILGGWLGFGLLMGRRAADIAG